MEMEATVLGGLNDLSDSPSRQPQPLAVTNRESAPICP